MPKKPVATVSSKLIQIESGEAWTTSLAIAEVFDRRHNDVMREVEGLMSDGTIDVRDFSHISYTDSMNRPQRAYRLNERAALIAMPFVGGAKSRAGQKRLVDAFMEMRRILRQHEAHGRSSDWLEARSKGKEVRRDDTDTIKDFIAYAHGQGSKSASKYYMQITKMSYREIFAVGNEAVEKNFRDTLSTSQLISLAATEVVIAKALREGMMQDLPYKEIYRMARDRVASLCSLIGKTVPAKRLSASNMPNFRLPA